MFTMLIHAVALRLWRARLGGPCSKDVFSMFIMRIHGVVCTLDCGWLASAGLAEKAH